MGRQRSSQPAWRLTLLVSLAALCLSILAPSLGAGRTVSATVLTASSKVLGQVRYIKRGLTVQPPHHRARKGKVKMSLYSAYYLSTRANQLASLGFRDGTVMHMNQHTDLILRDPHLTYVKRGEVEQTTVPGTGHRIETPTAAATAIGTEFDVRVVGKTSVITVIEGAVTVSDKRGSVIVKTGEQTTVAPNQAPQPPTPVNAPATVSWTGPIPPPAQPLARNIALDLNGGHIIRVSSQRQSPNWDVHYINDGRLDRGWESATGKIADQAVTMGFAGDSVATITGVVIDPAATGGHSEDNDLKDFQIRVSMSGTADGDFVTIFTGTAQQKDTLQRFNFASPVTARYLQLWALNNYGGDAIAVAEFEVAATGIPVARLTSTDTPTPAATPTSTSIPTRTPVPMPTNTSVPTRTPVAAATNTAVPTMTPVPPPAPNTPTLVPTATPQPSPTTTTVKGWSGTVTLTADKTAVKVGTTVNLTATVSSSISGTGATIVIGAPGYQPVTCSSRTTCQAQVSLSTSGRLTLSAWVQDASGARLASATPVTVSWYAVTISVDHPTVPVGTQVTITVTTDPDPGGTGLATVIVVDGGQTFPCSNGNPCTHQFTSNSAGTHTFTGYLADNAGNVVAQSGQVTVTWQSSQTTTWTIKLSADTQTPSYTSPVHFTATVNQDWTNSGYKLTLQQNDGQGYVFDQCTSPGFQWGCTFTVTYDQQFGNTVTYVAALQPVGQASNPVAVSNQVTIQWGGSPGTLLAGDGVRDHAK